MWESLQASYYQSVHRNGDVRVADWALVYSPWPTVGLCTGYVLLSILGPKFMASRPALDLKPALVVYNFALVAFSFYICMELFICSRLLGYNYLCDRMEYKTSPAHMRLAAAIWMFYFSKLVELMDTVFFILRKKNSQISFLHVYHHATMPFIWWIAIKWFAGGMAFFGPMLNCMVHMLMYAYYGLSIFPSMRKYLWWKRYLTMVQMIQFLIVLMITTYNLLTGCDYDLRVQWALFIYLITQFSLFLNFYIKSYTKPRSGSRIGNGDGKAARKEDNKASKVADDFDRTPHAYNLRNRQTPT